jgi:ribonuclease-3
MTTQQVPDAATVDAATDTDAGGTNDPLARLERALGHVFVQRQLLREALTHRSYAYECAAPGVVSNERLEFLGDAVLALLSADLLYTHNPGADEGRLTQLRAALVRASTLARFAEQLKLGPALRLGRGEEATGGRTRPLLLASAFEAVVGALYVDGGLPEAQALVVPLLAAEVELIEAGGERRIQDDKSRLQELAQGTLGVTPRYRLVSEEGPSHERTFRVEALLGEVVAGRGEGRSKRQAEQAAAHDALAEPGWRALIEAQEGHQGQEAPTGDSG